MADIGVTWLDSASNRMNSGGFSRLQKASSPPLTGRAEPLLALEPVEPVLSCADRQKYSAAVTLQCDCCGFLRFGDARCERQRLSFRTTGNNRLTDGTQGLLHADGQAADLTPPLHVTRRAGGPAGWLSEEEEHRTAVLLWDLALLRFLGAGSTWSREAGDPIPKSRPFSDYSSVNRGLFLQAQWKVYLVTKCDGQCVVASRASRELGISEH
ncbi:hypothetical protein EYF80_010784 [Liparis tanakae]|uniref:Uncharacterized protein n=1 Tax=Liparis tanakae TaxID=230148 RepID=A0A4Z2IMM2_9TELE|nr:hypothetical protein EYF80_010784 [Liparis tanakae]